MGPIPALASPPSPLASIGAARPLLPTTPQVDNNVSKNAQLLDVIAANQAVFKNNYGYQEWRRACEVRLRLWAAALPLLLKRAMRAASVTLLPPAALAACVGPHPLPSALTRLSPLQAASAGIRASIKGYKDLRDNLGEGLRFYMGLQVGAGGGCRWVLVGAG